MPVAMVVLMKVMPMVVVKIAVRMKTVDDDKKAGDDGSKNDGERLL